MLRALRSILVYVPSSECSMASVSAQVLHPYKRMDSTVPLKKRTFSSLLRLDLQIRDMPLRACQAKDFRTAMSLSVCSTHDPRYLKSSTHSSSVPSEVCSGGESSVLIGRPLVFLAFMPRPTFLHVLSTLVSSFCTFCKATHISKVTGDWHKPTTPWNIMQSSNACNSKQVTHGAACRHTTTLISHIGHLTP